MCNRNFVHAVSLTILFALQATSSHAQEAIGKATSVRPQAEGSHSGPLSGGSNVYSKETVRTGQSGQADLQFKDNSNLKVGSNSSVHLDQFVYDPNKSTGAVAIASDTRHVSVCDRIVGQRDLQDQDPLWHPWRARLIAPPRTEVRHRFFALGRFWPHRAKG